MYNPFILLNEKLLKAMLKQDMYFVRQAYPRGKDSIETNRKPFLLTHYTYHEIDKERAYRHRKLLWNDPNRFLYDSTNPVHLNKLYQAAAQPAGFKIYTNILLQPFKPTVLMRKQVYTYLRNRFTTWQDIEKEKITIRLQDLYGELYLVINWKGNKVEVLLDEVENVMNYVL